MSRSEIEPAISSAQLGVPVLAVDVLHWFESTPTGDILTGDVTDLRLQANRCMPIAMMSARPERFELPTF